METTLDGAQKVRYSFTVSTRARGAYKLIVDCDGAVAASKLRVKAKSKGRHDDLVAGKIRASVVDAPADAKPESETDSGAPIGAQSPAVSEFWLQLKPHLERSNSGCQSWVYERRPDVVEAIERRQRADWINSGQAGAYSVAYGDPGAWADIARRAGLPVDTTPTVGSVMVLPGHVESVAADGSFETSDRSATDADPTGVRRVWYTGAALSAAHGAQFIH